MRLVHLPDALTEDAVALWHASALTRPCNDPHADLRQAVTGPCPAVLAALDGQDLLLGTAMVGYDGHRDWVSHLAVRPESQRSGLGRTLMQASEAWLRDRSVPKVNLMVGSAGLRSGGEAPPAGCGSRRGRPYAARRLRRAAVRGGTRGSVQAVAQLLDEGPDLVLSGVS